MEKYDELRAAWKKNAFQSSSCIFQVDMGTTQTSRTSQKVAQSRLEDIINRLHEKILADNAETAANRVVLRFLPTNTDRDLLEPYDPEDETFFVSKHKDKFDRVFIGCSVTQLLTKSLVHCLKRSASSKKVTIYLETPLYLLHMADDIQQKYKKYIFS